MALRYYANAPATTLAASCTAVDTTITVTYAGGFPLSYPYILILDRGKSSEEVVLVTAAAGTVLTITRGYDTTTAFSHSLGAEVSHGISAIDPREANIHVNATSGVHGVSASLVGTTDTQTLTNKTLGSSNTLNGFTASKMAVTDGSGKLVAGSSAIPAGAVIGDTDTQTLTNKTLGSTNTINGFTASRFMQSDATGKLAASAKTLPSGAVVGDTDTQTLSNKTLSAPTINNPSISGPTSTNGTFTGGNFTATSNTFGTHIAFVGEIRMSAVDTPDAGWLVCNGQAVSRTTYASLFSKIGTLYGVGDGSTTFNLPNLQDRFPLGNSGTKTIGSTGGSATKVLTAGNLPPHKHTVDVGGATPGTANTVMQRSTGAVVSTISTPNGDGPGTSDPVDVMNPWLALTFVIKF